MALGKYNSFFPAPSIRENAEGRSFYLSEFMQINVALKRVSILVLYLFAWTAFVKAGNSLDLGPWQNLISFRAPLVIQKKVSNRGVFPLIWSIQPIENGWGDVNLDYYPVVIKTFPTISGKVQTPQELLAYVREHFEQFLEPKIAEFGPYDLENDEPVWESSDPTGAVMRFLIKDIVSGLNPDNGSVVVANATPLSWTFSTLWSARDFAHPVSGNREFGIAEQADGSNVFYTRGADRVTTPGDYAISTLIFQAADLLWADIQNKIVAYVNNNGGQAQIGQRISERHDWNSVRTAYFKPTVQWMSEIGRLVTLRSPSGLDVNEVNGINDEGQVVGTFTDGQGKQHGFVWSDVNDNAMCDSDELIVLPSANAEQSYASKINNSGIVVGNITLSSNPNFVVHSVFWKNGNLVDLQTLGGATSSATGVNDNGNIVGDADTADSETHAYIWHDDNGNGKLDANEVTDLKTLGGSQSSASAINNSGQVVGDSYLKTTPFTLHAVEWSSNTLKDLGTLEGVRAQHWQLTALGKLSDGQLTKTRPYLHLTDLSGKMEPKWLNLELSAGNVAVQSLSTIKVTSLDLQMTLPEISEVSSGKTRMGMVSLTRMKFGTSIVFFLAIQDG